MIMVQETLLENSPVRLSELLTDASVASGPPQSLGLSRDKWESNFGDYPSFADRAGLYTFWWKINEQISLPPGEKTLHWVKGKRRGKSDLGPLSEGMASFPSGSTKYWHYRGSWEFIPCELRDGRYVPLYVGKSTDIFRRIGEHLRWPAVYADNYFDQLDKKEGLSVIPRYGTSSQFSDHFHFLFREQFRASQQLKVRHVYLSVAFTAFANYADRFFGEDWLIGKLRPPFNLDSER